MVRGAKQVFPVDNADVWAPMAKYPTIRTLLAMTAAEGMAVVPLDVETSFRNGDVEEELYVRQNRGYERGDKTKVCCFLKALYGLKQAARAWYKNLGHVLIAASFRACDSVPCLFKGQLMGSAVRYSSTKTTYWFYACHARPLQRVRTP